MDFLIKICSDYHLNSIKFITVASGCLCFVMSLCMPYVCIVCICVFACNSTCTLLYTEDMFSLMNSRLIKSLINLSYSQQRFRV